MSDEDTPKTRWFVPTPGKLVVLLLAGAMLLLNGRVCHFYENLLLRKG